MDNNWKVKDFKWKFRCVSARIGSYTSLARRESREHHWVEFSEKEISSEEYKSKIDLKSRMRLREGKITDS